MLLFVSVFLLLCSSLPAAVLQGKVVHFESGERLARVEVRLLAKSGTAHPAESRMLTGEDGEFRFEALVRGTYELTVSAVGFGWVKRTVEVNTDSADLSLEVVLRPGVGIEEELTVVEERSAESRELNAEEIDKMKNVLLDDPIRALQHLPELASGDDFNTGFAVEGSGYDRVGILLDGIPAYAFQHTVEGIEDTGSTSLLSADLISSIGLVSAGTSSALTAGSAGHIDLRTRSGTASRRRSVVSISGSAFSLITEGPLPRGDWIVSARKSYVDWIVRRIDPETSLSFGFSDFFGKFSRSIGAKHQLELSGIYGRTGLHDVVEGSSIDNVDEGSFSSVLAHVNWMSSWGESLSSASHFYYQRKAGANRNQESVLLWKDAQEVAGVRTVWTLRKPARLLDLTWGASLERWSVDNSRYLPGSESGRFAPLWAYSETPVRQSLFLENRIALDSKWDLVGGWSYDRQAGLTGGYHSPFAGILFRPAPEQSLSVFIGRSGQFPFFDLLYGLAGNPALKPERALNLHADWSYRAASGLHLKLSGYRRKREEVAWRTEGLWRLTEGIITPPSPLPPGNQLEDSSYGGDLRLGRAVANGLSGWVGYAWERSRWSTPGVVGFPGNYDQRHGLSLFAHYRRGADLEASLKWKASGGLPLPAFARLADDGRYYLAEERNRERLPFYSRLDFRLGKSVNRDRFRVTFFVEILNLLNRENLRYAGHDFDSVNPHSGRIYGLVQKQFPILPTAGAVFEF